MIESGTREHFPVQTPSATARHADAHHPDSTHCARPPLAMQASVSAYPRLAIEATYQNCLSSSSDDRHAAAMLRTGGRSASYVGCISGGRLVEDRCSAPQHAERILAPAEVTLLRTAEQHTALRPGERSLAPVEVTVLRTEQHAALRPGERSLAPVEVTVLRTEQHTALRPGLVHCSSDLPALTQPLQPAAHPLLPSLSLLLRRQGDVRTRVVDASRVETLVDGVKRYAASTKLEGSSPADGDAAARVAPSTGGALAVGGAPSSSSGASAGGGGAPLVVAGFDVDEAADAIFDLLLTAESSPLQEIVLEQLALVLGAASRDAFATLRQRSGTLPASGGRSRLGALLDPLGLLRGSRLLSQDERDRQALDAAKRLAAIASDLVGSGERPQPSRSELRRLTTTLSSKVWQKRVQLRVVSRRLAAKMLDQAAQRVLPE